MMHTISKINILYHTHVKYFLIILIMIRAIVRVVTTRDHQFVPINAIFCVFNTQKHIN